MKWLFLFATFCGILLTSAVFSAVPSSRNTALVTFVSPCQECFILNYPDRDSSAAAQDYRCGNLTYDGHKGTDFAVADEQKMRQGVPVKAAAAGKVLRVRDGVIDRKVVDPATVKGKECGNGLVIDHGSGWESQYCHLRQGSVRGRPGDQVEQGATLGLIGQSGLASFPHVHFQVQYQGKVIDLSAGVPQSATCRESQASLWQPEITYVPTGLIHAGFSNNQPSMAEIEMGKWNLASFAARSPAIIFWTRSYGVEKGDRLFITVRDPENKVIVDRQETLTKSNRLFLFYAGKQARSLLKSGKWQGKFQLSRNGKILIDVTRDIMVLP